MFSFIISSRSHVYLGVQISDDRMGEICSMDGREKKYLEFLSENPKETNRLEEFWSSHA